MALTVKEIKMKIKKEGKLTGEEVIWILDHIESLEKRLSYVGENLDYRIQKIERKSDDHIPTPALIQTAL